MRNLTRLLALVLLAGIGWAVYWFVGASATERVLTGWLDARRDDGWTAQAATVDTIGFPYRFDTTVEGLHLADPETGVGWLAPMFQILSLSYQPNQLILVWPGDQQIVVPGQTLDIVADTMRGSLRVGGTQDMPMQNAVLEVSGERIDSSLGWSAAVEDGQFAMRLTPNTAGIRPYDISVSASGLVPSSAGFDLLRDATGLPAVIDTLNAELNVNFDRPWDRRAIEERRPQPRQVRLTSVSAQWGNMALASQGEITIDNAGVPTGEIDMEVTNWRDLVALAEATGAISPDRVPLVTRALETISALSGDPNRLDVTLSFSRGLMSLGPVPLGSAPRILLP